MFQTTLKTATIYIAADPGEPKEILNLAGAKCFYKNAKDVDSGDTELAAGAAVTITEGVYFVSASSSEIGVRQLENVDIGDNLAVAGKATVAGTLGVTGATALTGATTPTGGVVSSGGLPGVYAGGWPPATAESGTDTAIAEKKLFLTSVFLPANKKLKGVAVLIGSVGAKGKIVAALFDATGKVLAKSSEVTEGTVTGTAKEIQKLAFTAEYEAVGPKTYFVGLTGNNAEDKFRTIPANVASDNIWTAEKELAAKNTMADFAAPPSTFTAAKGPVAVLY